MPDDFEAMWRALAPIGRASSGGYFRQPFTAPELELREWFREQARARDLAVRVDEFGNLSAWWRPDGACGPAVMTGSHLDSVLDGGAYDGPLGVVSAFAALDRLRELGFTPSRPIVVSAFVEEEGSRFGLACLGSRLAAGVLDWGEARELRDPQGVFLADAMALAGFDEPTGVASTLRDDVGMFVELHVEQGRDLVDRQVPIGLATGIWPHGRYRFDFAGQANHAGTTRMQERHDPMLTYAMTALAANKQARLADQRATFGRVETRPNSTNAVPSRVSAWLDARADSLPALTDLVGEIERLGRERAERDGTTLEVVAESVSDEVGFDERLTEALAAALPTPPPVIPTAAGHDAGVLSQAGIPTAMLFVRNPTGVSHSPDEHAETADCLSGVEALATCLAELAR